MYKPSLSLHFFLTLTSALYEIAKYVDYMSRLKIGCVTMIAVCSNPEPVFASVRDVYVVIIKYKQKSFSSISHLI